MIVKIRGAGRSWFLYGGAQFTAVAVAAQAEDEFAWLIALPVIAVISFAAWVMTFKRYRAVGDTPTSNIASAAQGYAEFLGRARNLPDTPLLAHVSNKPCCWFRYDIEERYEQNKWRTVDSGESALPFLLEDGTGTCRIDPDGAEILCEDSEQWDIGYSRRCTEWRIHEADPLYALGDFRTINAGEPLPAREEMGELLAEWKRDQPALLKRFDLDKSGELSLKEWALARAEAKRHVDRKRDEAVGSATATIDTLGKPGDGRLFLVSTHTPASVAKRFMLWCWGQLALFFIALGGFLWLLL